MSDMQLPEYFCWSKIGAEAGETVADILARKEAARAADDGLFLWGIGQSVGNSIRALLTVTGEPQVFFTDMVGPAKLKDSAPTSTLLWQTGRGALDGSRFDLPPHSLVTSRGDRAVHWALVCRSAEPITGQVLGLSFAKTDVRNIASGKVPADQQITTSVKFVRDPAASGTRLRVRFRADLVPPFLVELGSPLEVPDDLRRRLATGAPGAREALKALAEG